MKNIKTKSYVIIFQIVSLVFLLFSVISTLLIKNGYEIFIFGNICLYIVEEMGLLLFLLTEFIMFIVIAIKKKRPLFIIVNVLLFPLLFLQFAATDFALTTKPNSQVYSYDNFNKDIVIVNRSFLLDGNSDILEKDGVLLKKIATASGDDGYCPLENKENFVVSVSDDTITYTYYFDGYSLSEGYNREIIIQYNNGHFECIKDEYDE